MIKVNGEVTLTLQYSVELAITKEQFERLSTQERNDLIGETISWFEALDNPDTGDFEVAEIEKVE